MKIGLCAPWAAWEIADQAGFDYIEGPAHIIEGIKSVPIEMRYSTNLFFEGNTRLDLGEDKWLPSAKKRIEIAIESGVRVMVVGSGVVRKARSDEAGGIKLIAQAESLFMNALELMQEFVIRVDARETPLQIAPESLNRTETNVFNSLPHLSEDCLSKKLSFTADSYHCLFEGNEEGLQADLGTLEFWEKEITRTPTHVHISSLKREVPKKSDLQLQSFAQHLKALKYTGNVSIEANLGSGFDVAMLPLLHNAVLDCQALFS